MEKKDRELMVKIGKRLADIEKDLKQLKKLSKEPEKEIIGIPESINSME